jgi:hypothetical protein
MLPVERAQEILEAEKMNVFMPRSTPIFPIGGAEVETIVPEKTVNGSDAEAAVLAPGIVDAEPFAPATELGTAFKASGAKIDTAMSDVITRSLGTKA